MFFLLILLLKNFAEHSFLGELTDVTFWSKQVGSYLVLGVSSFELVLGF